MIGSTSRVVATGLKIGGVQVLTDVVDTCKVLYMNTKTTAKSIAQTVADQAAAKMTTAQMIDTIALIDSRNADEDGDMSIRAALFIALYDTLGDVVYEADDEAFDSERPFATVLREMM